MTKRICTVDTVYSLFLKIFHENQEGFLQSHNLIILLYVMLLKINMS